MKKILVLGMMVVMVMAVAAGCGQNEQPSNGSEPQAQVQSQEQQSQELQAQDQAQQGQDQQGVVYEDGVAMDPADYDLISEDEAKQIALNKVEGAAASDIWAFDLDYDDRHWVYEGEIHLGEWEYEFEINAESGDVISFEKDHIYD